jgi:hypothetical protein
VLRPLTITIAVVLLAGCGASNIPYPDDDAVTESKLVTIDGIRFERPAPVWRLLEPHWLDPANAVHVEAHEVARSLGIRPRRFKQVLGGVDIFVVDHERNRRGLFDLMTVDSVGSALPDADELMRRLRSRGAHGIRTSSGDTRIGSATIAMYTVGRGARRVFARTVLVDVDGELDITVAAATRVAADRLVEGVLDTLDED